MDFVSAHHGAIPATAMRSPGQFEHRLLARAKSEVVAAALAHGVVPAHNVTLDLKNVQTTASDAQRARLEFGFMRMWSIYPTQIEAIVSAMQPNFDEVSDAAAILLAAQAADWGPIQYQGRATRPRDLSLFLGITPKSQSLPMSPYPKRQHRHFLVREKTHAHPTAGARFRAAIKAERPLQIVGTITPITRYLPAIAVFRRFICLVAAWRAGSLGLPDLGISTLDDVLVDVRRISDVCATPLLVDIDTGFGGAFNIARSIRALAKAGAAAVHIEDQVQAKRCGHRPNKAIVSQTEMVDRIKAAVDAQARC